MVLKKEISLQIKNLLKENPHGLRITDIVNKVKLNRNTAGRYLENMLVSGQVEMRRFGMAKIYKLTERVPLSALLSISSELVIQLDSSLRVIYANEPFLLLVGTDSKSLIGKNIEYSPVATMFDDLFPQFIEKLKEGIAGKQWADDIILPTKDFILFCRIAPTVFDDGRKGVTVILEDITEKKLAEKALQNSEMQYRSLVETTGTGYVIVDKDGRVVTANQEYIRLTGRSTLSEIEGRPVTDWTAPYDLERNAREIEKCFRRGQVRDLEIDYQRPDRTIQPIEINASVIQSNSGKIILTLCRDITQRKETEQRVAESEAKLRSIAENSPDVILLLNLNLEIIFISQTYTMKSDQVCGKPVYDFIPREFQSAATACFEQVLKTGKTATYGTEYHFAEGTTLYFESTVGPVFKDGAISALVINARDITDRKKSEDALRESEERYRQLVDISPDAVIIHQEGKITYLNPAAMSMLRAKNVNELLGKKVLDLIHPDYRHAVRENIEKDLKGEMTPPIELDMLRLDGTTIIAEGRGIKTTFNGKSAIQVAIRETTERKRIEMELRDSEEKYRTLIERANDVICIIQDGIVKMCNPRLPELWGGSMEEIIGKSISDFIHPDCLPTVVSRYKQRMAGENPPSMYEILLIRKDGSKSYAEVNAGIISYEGKPADLIIARDINERKKAENALRESEAIARALIYAPTDSIILTDIHRKILALNETAARRLGGKSDELVGMVVDDLLPKEVMKTRKLRIDQVIEKKTMVQFEDERDGRWYETVAYPVESESGEVQKIAIVSRDITERKNTAIQLRESDLRIRLILDCTEDLIIMQDPEGRYLYLNSAVRYGVPMEKALGLTPYDFIDQASADRLVERVKTVAKTGQSMQEESPIIWNGEKLWFCDSLSPIRDANGNVSAVITISHNITERKHAEIALRESEATARALLNAQTDSLLLIDDQGMILALNEIAASRFGKRSNELVGTMLYDLLPKEIAQLRRSLMAPVLEKKEMVRFVDERAGTWYDTVAYPILNETGEVKKIAIFARDITEQKTFEKRLRESEQMYKSLLEQTFDAIAMHKEGKIAFLNDRAAKILGASRPEDLMGKSIFEFIHPDSRRALEDRIQKLTGDQGRPGPVITEKFIRTDGSTVTVEVLAISFDDNGTPAFRVAFREISPCNVME